MYGYINVFYVYSIQNLYGLTYAYTVHIRMKYIKKACSVYSAQRAHIQSSNQATLLTETEKITRKKNIFYTNAEKHIEQSDAKKNRLLPIQIS